MSDLFCLDEEKSAHFSANEAEGDSGGAHFAKSNARPPLCTDPLPEILKKTLLIRLHHDILYFFINSLIIFGVHSTSLFLSAQPYFEMIICLLCIFFGISNHYIYTQLRTHTPWKLFARPILKPHEFHQFETTVEAKLTAFERVHVWMIILEKNILFPLLVANLMTTQAWTMPFWPIPMMALCSFRIARTALPLVILFAVALGYAQPQMLCVPLSFTYLLSSVGLVAPVGHPTPSSMGNEQRAMVPPAMFTLYLLTMIWPKVQEFILKIHFIAVYVAPWQISWGSAFHAFAQPFSVPHSGFICAQAAISSLLSSPLNPLLDIRSFSLSSFIVCKMSLEDGEPVAMLFDFNDQNVCGYDDNSGKMIFQLNKCGFPESKMSTVIDGNMAIIEGYYHLSDYDYVHFHRSIILPENSDTSTAFFINDDPTFIEFRCNVSSRGALKKFERGYAAGNSELKIFNLHTGLRFPDHGEYHIDTCGFPPEKVKMIKENDGLVLKGHFAENGDSIWFSKLILTQEGDQTSKYAKYRDGSLLKLIRIPES